MFFQFEIPQIISKKQIRETFAPCCENVWAPVLHSRELPLQESSRILEKCYEGG